MKRIIYLIILTLMLHGCITLKEFDSALKIDDRNGFDIYNKVSIIQYAKVYYVPKNSFYGFVAAKDKEMFVAIKTFSDCDIGDLFWKSPEYQKIIKTVGFTPQNLKLAEFEQSAGCVKAGTRVY